MDGSIAEHLDLVRVGARHEVHITGVERVRVDRPVWREDGHSGLSLVHISEFAGQYWDRARCAEPTAAFSGASCPSTSNL